MPKPGARRREIDGIKSARIDRFDHIVLTVADVEASCAFYRDILGMTVVTFGEGRKAMTFESRT